MRKIPIIACAGLLATALLSVPSASSAHDGGHPPVETSDFQQVTLNDTPGEPIDLAVLPDNRVLHTTRNGQVWLHDPDTGLNKLAAELDVYLHDEEGLQSVAVDPGFGWKNRWVYLYYAPPMDTPEDDPATPDVNEGDAPEFGDPEDFEPYQGATRLSRFKLRGDTLDLDSEQQILQVEADRGVCCHVGGDIVFDRKGLLYLSTGDDTNPFQSGGYAPLDERPDRNPAFDAQRTSADTSDLRGKVLRIDVRRDGSYRIPKGNLFKPGTPKTRPEIYLMGLRNPFRIEVDPKTSELYVADYSPDARHPDPQRGPNGHGRWFAADEAANYGWPYCVTPDLAYQDWDFATESSRGEFDCAAPVNDSPNNTGRSKLPAVADPEVWYPSVASESFPELGTGGVGPMAGPAYDFRKWAALGPNAVAWPKHYEGTPLFYEWTRDYIKGFHRDRKSGEVTSIEDVVPEMDLYGVIDMEFGRDGALYLLEYGKGYFAENDEARLSRIDYVGAEGNRSPEPKVSASPEGGLAPLTVAFSSEGTTDADGDSLRYAWDFDADGRVDSRERNPEFTYTENGVYRATLQVTDDRGRFGGRSASADVRIVVGNDVPQVSFVEPADGAEFQLGDRVDYRVTVTDDQPFDCSRVAVHYVVGHNEHGHPQTTANGCVGSIQTGPVEGHDPAEEEIRGVFTAVYTDPGGNGLPSLSGSAEVVLIPTH